MIGRLCGKLIEKRPPFLLLDVQGVGYYIQAPLSTFFHLPELGHDVTLRTHFIVREDAQLLYGFLTQEECLLFQEIIKINGVGPKVALAILSGLSPAEFVGVVSLQEVRRLQSLPGIGAKTAQRILVEMQDRLTKIDLSHGNGTTDPASLKKEESAIREAVLALISLGYKQSEAQKAVNNVKESGQGCEYIIKEALQGLAKV